MCDFKPESVRNPVIGFNDYAIDPGQLWTNRGGGVIIKKSVSRDAVIKMVRRHQNYGGNGTIAKLQAAPGIGSRLLKDCSRRMRILICDGT